MCSIKIHYEFLTSENSIAMAILYNFIVKAHKIKDVS